MNLKNLNEVIVFIKWGNKAKMKESKKERTRSQEDIIHKLAKFKKGVEEKIHSEMKIAQKEHKEWT